MNEDWYPFLIIAAAGILIYRECRKIIEEANKKPQVSAPPPAVKKPSVQEDIIQRKKPWKPEDVYIPQCVQAESADVPEFYLTPEEAAGKGFSFRKKSKSVRITNYHGDAKYLVIPSHIGGKRVNEIGKKAFCKNQTIRKLLIPSAVRKIGAYTFRDSNLEICIFADGLTEIPECAFSGCKNLKKVTLPKTLYKIGDSAFAGCGNLKYLHFPPQVWNIGENAFSYSGLEGFSITNGYQRISNGNAFRDTPMEKNHTLIIGNHIDYIQHTGTNYKGLYVTLVGQKSKEITVPECSWLMFGKNSFGNTAGWCHFYLYNVESPVSFYRAFDSKTDNTPVEFYFPQDYNKKLYLPYWAHAYRGLKSRQNEIPCHIEGVSENQEFVMTIPAGMNLTRNDISSQMSEKTIIRSERKGTLHRIEEDAFHAYAWNLSVCVLDLLFYATDKKIFADNCYKLHKVVWYEKNQEIIKYIPCSDLIGVPAHTALLQAFRTKQNENNPRFFDSQLILDAMQKKISGVHTRQRIFIALDALRSEKRKMDVNTDFFLYYLKKRKEQAELLFTEVSEDYPEYLEYFRSLPFMNQAG